MAGTGGAGTVSGDHHLQHPQQQGPAPAPTPGLGAGRSKEEAVGMMALHEALRNVCLTSDWTYSVFWTVRPRPRCRGGNGCKVGDDNGSLMLMWEDGFCRTRSGVDCRLDDMDGEDPVRKAFGKMSIQLYNYGEGLMGKVASDKCHKWVFKEPSECEPNISNYWQSSFDAIPPEWTDQFESGIQTIAVIQAGHGLLQLGSCKIIPEDLHFVLRMRHMFESLGYQSGFFLSQLFSSARNGNGSSNGSPPMTFPRQSATPMRPPPVYNWAQHRPLANPTSGFNLGAPHMGLLGNSRKDIVHNSLFLPIDGTLPEHDADLKWPNGLSFFTALTTRTDDSKILLGSSADAVEEQRSQLALFGGMEEETKPTSEASSYKEPTHVEEYLSLESHSNKSRKMEGNGKFKRSFTLPARMASSSSSSPIDTPRQGQAGGGGLAPHVNGENRGSEGGIYSDIMETFLE